MPATWSGKGLQEPREELALLERCGACCNKFVPIQRNVDNTPILFGFQDCRTVFPTIALAGNRVLPALGSLSRNRRVGRGSPSPRRINMKANQEICNRSFGHLLEPKKSP